MKPDNGPLDLERMDLTDAPELKRALDAVKQQLPDPQQLATLAAGLSQIGISVAPSQPAAPSTQSAARLKLLLGAGVVGPLAIALLLGRMPTAHFPAAASPTTPPTPASASSSQAAPPGSALHSNPRHPLQASSRVSEAAAAGAPSAISSAGDATTAESALRPALGTAALVQAAPPATLVSTATAEHARPPVASARATTDTIGPGVVARPTEVALLRDARLALNHDPSEALALAERHRVLFARGAMIQERELIAISALARLGRHTAVLARASQFERDFPTSPYRKQVSALAQ